MLFVESRSLVRLSTPRVNVVLRVYRLGRPSVWLTQEGPDRRLSLAKTVSGTQQQQTQRNNTAIR